MKRISTHFSELDGLRGLLSLWVAVTHILCWTGIADMGWRFPERIREAWGVFMYAHAAVDTFIILSGFVISFLVVKFRHSYGQFMTNRAFRIYPVFLVCLIFAVAASGVTQIVLDNSTWAGAGYLRSIQKIAASEQREPVTHILLHLTLLNGIVPNALLASSTATFLPPAWSITLEWQYYVFAPIIAALVLTARGLLILLAIAIIGMIAAPYWTNPHLAFLPSQLPLFLIGIATYHTLNSDYLGSLLAAKKLEAVTISLCGVAIMAQWHATALVIWLLTVGSITWSSAENTNLFFGRLGNFLRSSKLQTLGKASYPLYLVHWPLIYILLFLLQQLVPNVNSISAALFMLIVGLPIMLLISLVLHKAVEAPGIALGRRVIGNMRTQRAGAEAKLP